MSVENLPPIYRTNYSTIESRAKNCELSRDSIHVLGTPRQEPLVINWIKDHLGNRHLFVTSGVTTEEHNKKLLAFLSINPDPTYKGNFETAAEKEKKPGRQIIDSVYITTVEDKNDDVMKEFKELTGKDLPIRTVPKYPNKLVVNQNKDELNLELQLPVGYTWHNLKS